MIHFLKLFCFAVTLTVLIDCLWLGVLMNRFYITQLGDLARGGSQGFKPLLLPAMAVYIFIPFGILLFVLPRINPTYLFSALGWGFLFGLTLYAVYDMTNYALIRDWPLKMSLVDICWGGTLCAIVSYATARFDLWLR
ncbi:MAG: DUF2177 family protein [Desulfobacterales bacterium]|jgi:uncharacterized membrane protein|nr:DUF2177 family protein [Desulfobacterales bacterium]